MSRGAQCGLCAFETAFLDETEVCLHRDETTLLRAYVSLSLREPNLLRQLLLPRAGYVCGGLVLDSLEWVP